MCIGKYPRWNRRRAGNWHAPVTIGGEHNPNAGASVNRLAPWRRGCYARRMPAPVLPLIELAALLPSRGALIGLDLGEKTIGVAVSDPERRLAAGVETIARKTFTGDAARLLALVQERRAVGFVLGLPLNMNGSEGPRAQSARAFARNLAQRTALPIGLWDERLSTAAVERELIAADASRAKRKAVIDQHAAVFILQGALDRLQRGNL
jgi:putative Holliday junction resolvase